MAVLGAPLEAEEGSHRILVSSSTGHALQNTTIDIGRGFEKYLIVPLRGQCFAVFELIALSGLDHGPR